MKKMPKWIRLFVQNPLSYESNDSESSWKAGLSSGLNESGTEGNVENRGKSCAGKHGGIDNTDSGTELIL